MARTMFRAKMPKCAKISPDITRKWYAKIFLAFLKIFVRSYEQGGGVTWKTYKDEQGGGGGK